MAIVIQNVRDIRFIEGEHTIPGIRFRPARQALGVAAWGMNVIDFDPGCQGYPEHDHTHDGQEEVYVVLDGSIVLLAEGRERTLRQGDMVRVPAEVTRKFVTRGEPATLLALGGTPGKPYAVDPRLITT